MLSRGFPYLRQHYPQGTQEKYNSFQSRITVMKDGVKTEINERRGGGLEIRRISDERTGILLKSSGIRF
jgi:hypothetical protein